MKKRLVWKLYPTYLLIVMLALGALAWSALRGLVAAHVESVQRELSTVARLAAASLAGVDVAVEPERAAAVCARVGAVSGYRVTLIRPDGLVIGESDGVVQEMHSHINRPEVAAALRGEIGYSTRRSPTLGQEMAYVAVPLQADGRVTAVVRAAVATANMGRQLRALRVEMLWIAGGITLVAMLLSMLAARWIQAPLRALEESLQAVSAGGTRVRLPVSGILELDALAAALNSAAEQAEARLQTIVAQRDEQETLFACMSEGVLAVDHERRLLSLNAAAAALFGVDPGKARGRPVVEVMRNADLDATIERTLANGAMAEGEIYLPEGERHLLVHGRVLEGAGGRSHGAVLVLNDVTRLRRLERMRQDFIANVSHELKTPVTSIKGYVETLLDGGEHASADVRRFLQAIERQSQRLQTLIDDILVLARVEHGAEAGRLECVEMPVADVLAQAVKLCASLAEVRAVRVEVQCAPELRARLNAPLMEQAVANLIDNAIKYGQEGAVVRVAALAGEGGKGCVIQVRDEGPGIPRHHHERLFERFYRVDKGRCSKFGGTGLGLAIVKHTAIAHGGQVSVDSAPGRGSLFSIHLP